MPKENIPNFTANNFLLLTYCTLEKFVHTAYLPVCFILQMSAQCTRESLFHFFPQKAIHFNLPQRQVVKIFLLQTAILIYFKSKTFCHRTLNTLSWSSYHLVTFCLREICEFQVSNLTSNWNPFESSLGIEIIRTIRKMTVA